jgi:D-beta-D-heptose 7-phosphate kinase/D-beta-D-heptose 1-phosphate adenosyltransferase
MSLLSSSLAKNKVSKLKKSGKVVVFTNGCFDLIHKGHTTYLKKARMLGDLLIVGLNSDESVSNLKGENRPINSIKKRSANLLKLDYVDVVVIFEENTPRKLINEICPNILVKGGDYTKEEVVGADQVLKNGGEVVIIPLVPGYSTTKMINALKEKA